MAEKKGRSWIGLLGCLFGLIVGFGGIAIGVIVAVIAMGGAGVASFFVLSSAPAPQPPDREVQVVSVPVPVHDKTEAPPPAPAPAPVKPTKTSKPAEQATKPVVQPSSPPDKTPEEVTPIPPEAARAVSAPRQVARVTAEGAKVTLVGSGSRYALPDQVPPGRYDIEAVFGDDEPFVAGAVTVGSDALTIKCTASMGICRAR